MTRSPRRPRQRRRTLAAAAVAIIAALTASLVGAPAASARAADEPVWKPVDAAGAQTELGLTADADVSAFDLDLGAVFDAPRLRSFQARSATPAPAPRHLSLPDPTGAFVDFIVHPVSVMEDALAARHPELKTYAGRAASDPTVSVRVSITPLGLSASVRSGDNRSTAWYVDPVPSDADDAKPRHISYGRDAAREDKGAAQFLEPANEAPVVEKAPAAPAKAMRQVIRLALATDPSFAQFYGTENVLAAKVVMTNRIAQIYNDDLGVQLKLVNGTEKLNFDTEKAAYEPGGACGDQACYPVGALNECQGWALDSNAGALQRILGDDAYDVGHLSLGSGNGGMANWNVVGVNWWKGGGCTGLAKPIGDVFATDYVAHELGHQFGGTHTMNACHNSQGDSAMEPGSASTIMGYAGLCRENDLQSNSDPYFSAFSIDQMHYWTGWAGLHEESPNTVPQVTVPESRKIPVRTPFALTASGTDSDGDPLTYVWEQANLGDFGRGLRDPNKVNGPLFRLFSRAADLTEEQAHSYYSGAHNAATPTPTRVFPDMAQILAGNTNARTGTCESTDWLEARDCFSEFLPTAAYEGNGNGGFDFRVTARDQRPDGGGVATAGVHLAIARDAGPFEVTSFATAGQAVGVGSTSEITWNVNGTDAADMAPEVRILLSTDGGQTFDRVLAERTANDGAATVTFPKVATDKARIKIEAVDNYFFAVNEKDFVIFDATLESIVPQVARTIPGVPITLPATVVPVYNGLPSTPIPVTWDTSGVDWATAGTYRVIGSGVDQYGTTFSDAVLTLYIGDFSSTDPVSVTVPEGQPVAALANLLPPTVPAQVGTSETRFATAVTWNTAAITQKDLDAAGTVRVGGTAASAIPGAAGIPATLTVIVTTAAKVNVAPDSNTRSATFTEPGYSINGTVNGNLGDKAWSNWRPDGVNENDTLTYAWKELQLLDSLDITAFRDGAGQSWPAQASATYTDAVSGQVVTTAPVPVDLSGASPVVTIDLRVDGHPIMTGSVAVHLTPVAGWYMTVSEVQIFGRKVTPASTATLARLNVDGVPVTGFDPATLTYAATVDGSRWPTVSAVATDQNATVTVGAVDPATGRVTIAVTAADKVSTQAYEVVVARRAAFTAAPRLTNAAGRVTVVAPTDPADATLRVVWLRNGVEQAQKGTSYALAPADAGTSLVARVTAERAGFVSAQVDSAPLAIPANDPGGSGSGGSGSGGSGAGTPGAGGSGTGTPATGGSGTEGSTVNGSTPAGTSAGTTAAAGSSATTTSQGRLSVTGTPGVMTPIGVAGVLLALGSAALIAARSRRRPDAVVSPSVTSTD